MNLPKNIVLKTEGQDAVSIVNDNTTIGYATINTSLGELSYIFVHPAYRRRGFGTMLISTAEKISG